MTSTDHTADTPTASGAHRLAVPGARLRYTVRGRGPLLMLIGAPMSADHFAGLADALAADHTVVTHDPRGTAGSRIEGPEHDSTPQLRADDAVAVLDALGAESADVFGSSGGAVTGLAMAERHPGRVRTLVAHEPPLTELLPDAAEHRAATDDIVATFHREGPGAAWMKFMANAGFDTGPGDPEAAEAADAAPQAAPEEPSEQDLADTRHFFVHQLQATTRYVPDAAKVAAGAARVVVGIGADSGHLLTHRTTTALADLLGVEPTVFPGDHGGFLGAPAEFAAALRAVLDRA
ncbi:alpha/beta fold hydrolase [Streptomonospora nanhaiensis]|uniref:alpha/beta fold hydrolase n=1 Tax=Streptomonospora nanhaiensis TaxID=1323731 RepID=UPI001C389E2C|nr:alpha/beta hydrolase [Streptomonospora nanhaiensis]MBV2363290.1 alpha/beta hydrolase [Streptomonospora nanhaiensis]MBX9390907.1 alpha/beta hydrolase [Streptomonospora nanhaiensis]